MSDKKVCMSQISSNFRFTGDTMSGGGSRTGEAVIGAKMIELSIWAQTVR